MTEMDINIIKNKNCFFTIKIFVGYFLSRRHKPLNKQLNAQKYHITPITIYIRSQVIISKRKNFG